jgi:hypothetical protein
VQGAIARGMMSVENGRVRAGAWFQISPKQLPFANVVAKADEPSGNHVRLSAARDERVSEPALALSRQWQWSFVERRCENFPFGGAGRDFRMHAAESIEPDRALRGGLAHTMIGQ